MDETENYKVKDISLADWGRKELNIAEKRIVEIINVKEELEKDLVEKTTQNLFLQSLSPLNILESF